jgi:hypothetical protein
MRAERYAADATPADPAQFELDLTGQAEPASNTAKGTAKNTD